MSDDTVSQNGKVFIPRTSIKSFEQNLIYSLGLEMFWRLQQPLLSYEYGIPEWSPVFCTFNIFVYAHLMTSYNYRPELSVSILICTVLNK